MMMAATKNSLTLDVQGNEIRVIAVGGDDYISLTDMLRSKDGDFFLADWLRNRNTVEYLGVWEKVHNPNFNYGEFAIIKSQAGLNSYKISVKDWVEKTNLIPATLSAVQISYLYASEADLLNMALFGFTAKSWREAYPNLGGNMRDHANMAQLVCLSNMENLNALFINEGLPQNVRLQKLNAIAISQMKLLVDDGKVGKLGPIVGT